jgi:predicted component of viral defense system (DUF524 family)
LERLLAEKPGGNSAAETAMDKITEHVDRRWGDKQKLTYSPTHSLTPQYSIFFEKLIVSQLVKEQPAFFMEPKG